MGSKVPLFGVIQKGAQRTGKKGGPKEIEKGGKRVEKKSG